MARGGRHAAVLALTALTGLAGCGDATPLQDLRESNTTVMRALMGTSRPPPDSGQNQVEYVQDTTCPPIEIRTGAEHFDIYEDDAIREPLNVRYQATISRVARECDHRDTYLAIEFGFAGRVLIGPKGTPGTVTLPVRAVFAGKGDQELWSKNFEIPVTIAPGEESKFFAHVTDELVYQYREGDQLKDFIIYIGFTAADQPLRVGAR